ncbi:MAG: tetratricopeptide repeat protein, partial [Chloroflexota bacterium]
MEDFESAIIDYDAAILITDDSDELYYDSLASRGASYYFLGDFTNAIADLTLVIDNVTVSVQSYAVRGESYYFQENWQLALADFNTVIELDNTNAGSFANRGLIHYYLGNQSSALEDWEEAFSLNPDISTSFRDGVQQLIRYELYPTALQRVNDIILLDAYNGVTRWQNNFYRAYIHLQLGNNLDAILDATLVIEDGGDEALSSMPEILLVRSEGYLNLGFLESGLEDANDYILLAPDDREGYAMRGNIHFADDNFELALS